MQASLGNQCCRRRDTKETLVRTKDLELLDDIVRAQPMKMCSVAGKIMNLTVKQSCAACIYHRVSDGGE